MAEKKESGLNSAKWTEKQIELLHEHYANTRANDLKEFIGRSISSIYMKANAIGLKKSNEYLSKMPTWVGDRKTTFQKENVPFNKGKKWDEYMSVEGRRILRQTTWKKGNLPHTNTFDGNITLRSNKGTKWYAIRLSKAVWQPYNQYLWEKEYGKIPQGSIVVFKDKNTLNCTIENLELITRKENMARNTIQRYSPELQRTIKLLANVKSKLKSNQ
jgi:HNH endonuclease